jgi:hypothetical protein
MSVDHNNFILSTNNWQTQIDNKISFIKSPFPTTQTDTTHQEKQWNSALTRDEETAP